MVGFVAKESVQCKFSWYNVKAKCDMGDILCNDTGS